MSNFNYNHVQIAGRITKDPELKTGKDYTLLQFAVAIKEDKDNTTFVNCTAWNKVAEFINVWFQKGDPIWIDGKLSQKTYETSDRKKRSVLDVYVISASFIDSKADKEARQTDKLEEVDELPF